MSVKDYKPVKREWQRVRIPLADFSSSASDQPRVDLTRLIGVQICFEWESMEGTVYVSGLAFEAD